MKSCTCVKLKLKNVSLLIACANRAIEEKVESSLTRGVADVSGGSERKKRD